jgi:hypothetical protein
MLNKEFGRSKMAQEVNRAMNQKRVEKRTE